MLKQGRFKVNSGKKTSFWEGLWIGREPLKVRFPALYRTVRRKGDSVARMLNSTFEHFFRRALVGERLADWLNLVP